MGSFDGDVTPKLASDEILLEAINSAVQNGLFMARHPKAKPILKRAFLMRR